MTEVSGKIWKLGEKQGSSQDFILGDAEPGLWGAWNASQIVMGVLPKKGVDVSSQGKHVFISYSGFQH